MKRYLILFLFFFLGTATYAQEQRERPPQKDALEIYDYVYIKVEAKFLSSRLKVTVDLGETEEQIRAAETLSYNLTNKRSQVAILNYMSALGYEVVSSHALNSMKDGDGGSYATVYIMKRPR